MTCLQLSYKEITDVDQNKRRINVSAGLKARLLPKPVEFLIELGLFEHKNDIGLFCFSED